MGECHLLDQCSLYDVLREFLSNRKSCASSVETHLFLFKDKYKFGSWSYVPFRFSCCETQEPNLWPNFSTCQVLYCPLPSDSILSCCICLSKLPLKYKRSRNKLKSEINTFREGWSLLSCRLEPAQEWRPMSGFRCNNKAKSQLRMWDGNEVEANPGLYLHFSPMQLTGCVRAAARTRGTEAWDSTPHHAVKPIWDDTVSNVYLTWFGLSLGQNQGDCRLKKKW